MNEVKIPSKVKCPTCRKEILYDTKSSFRPFCSERCRLIDLGDWASENFKIPVTSSDPMGDQDFDLESELTRQSEEED